MRSTDLTLALDRVGLALAGYPIHVHDFDVVGSTNDVAAHLAQGGAPEGTVVLAGRQTAGRGRDGRVWHSPPGAGIYVSMVLRPGGPPRAVAAGRTDRLAGSAVAPPTPAVAAEGAEDTALVTIMAGAAAAEAIERATGLSPSVKWPNDLVVERRADSRLGRRKLAGILAEGCITGTVLQHVILGVGVNLRPAAFPAELEAIVTSIESETGRPVDFPAVVAELLVALVRGRLDLLEGRHRDVVSRWRARAGASLGRPVEWQAGQDRRRGTTRDIDESGALLVETAAGLERITAGEVTWL
jgi:BirA family biotin operon repressor/biotin-[acetyl-CoA-carboxylase] ligase